MGVESPERTPGRSQDASLSRLGGAVASGPFPAKPCGGAAFVVYHALWKGPHAAIQNRVS